MSPIETLKRRLPDTVRSSSLYVYNFDRNVTRDDLRKAFQPAGTILSVILLTDRENGSLGCAYVNYFNPESCQEAINTLFPTFNGRPCKIALRQGNPALRPTGASNVFVKNLDPEMGEQSFHDMFADFGNILSRVLVTDKSGKSKGHGFVQFETVEAAQKCIKTLNGMCVNDKKLYVDLFIPREKRNEEKKAQFTNVIVKNLDLNVTQKGFNDLFQKYGEVISGVIQTDEKGQSKGFGFANYATHEEAQKAVDNLNNTEFMGKTIIVSRFQSKEERKGGLTMKKKNLYVKNFEHTVGDAELRSMFEPFGNITSCVVKRDEKNASKGFGFVCFSTTEEASKALAKMNGVVNDMTIQSRPLYVAYVQPPEVRRVQTEMAFSQIQGIDMRGYAQPNTRAPSKQVPYGVPSAIGGFQSLKKSMASYAPSFGVKAN